MRILSPWKDYYDSMRCYANPSYCSDDFAYIRKTLDPIDITFERGYHFNVASNEDYGFKYKVESFVIGFCGAWYPGYIVIKPQKQKYTLDPPTPDIKEYYYNYRSAMLAALDHELILKGFKKNNFKSTSTLQAARSNTASQTMETLIRIYKKDEDKCINALITDLNKQDLFITHKTPTLLVNIINTNSWKVQTQITINPNLEKLSFYKCIEGNIAYQEIEMFLGNELLPKDDPDQLTNNNDKIERHGFDLKTSFRKAPNKLEKHHKRKRKLK